VEIKNLLIIGRKIWSDKMNLSQIIVALGVVYGDICRFERNANKDRTTRQDKELKKELGNIIFSTIRWCDDLDYDPEECLSLAIKAQKEFQKTEK
jgi:hypothetical protein